MRNRRKIKEHDDCSRILINEDISPEKRKQWAELKLIVDQAGREGMKARQIGDTIEFTGRLHLRYSFDEFRIMLNGYGWNDFYLMNEVNEMWKVFLSRIVLR